MEQNEGEKMESNLNMNKTWIKTAGVKINKSRVTLTGKFTNHRFKL